LPRWQKKSHSKRFATNIDERKGELQTIVLVSPPMGEDFSVLQKTSKYNLQCLMGKSMAIFNVSASIYVATLVTFKNSHISNGLFQGLYVS